MATRNATHAAFKHINIKVVVLSLNTIEYINNMVLCWDKQMCYTEGGLKGHQSPFSSKKTTVRKINELISQLLV